MSKAKKIILISISCLFALLSTFVFMWYFADSYPTFYSKAEKGFEITGLSEGFVPQGLTYESRSQYFLYSGYMQNGTASRVYVYDAEKQENIKYFTLKIDNQDYVGHAGGIATDGTNVWVAGDGLLHRFMFADVKNVENGQSINVVDTFETGNGADSVSYSRGVLIVGEFHRDGSHETDQSHHFEANGKTNKALTFLFKTSTSQSHGLKSTIPYAAISTGSLVQGLTFSTNNIVVSTSYSLANSKIYNYSRDFSTSNYQYNCKGIQIPVYILQDFELLEEIDAPCMSEEIITINNKAFLIFESACKKYSFATREQLRNIYYFEFKTA